jgi:hypothetical protein
MISAERNVFTPQMRRPVRAEPVNLEDYSEGKWPVWVRLLTIIGLSAGLWAAIIWAVVSIFG